MTQHRHHRPKPAAVPPAKPVKRRRRKGPTRQADDLSPLHGILVCIERASTWIRCLQEDGDVESHPGPRYISKNINSIQSIYATFKSIRSESDRDPITAVFIQDHRIRGTEANKKAVESVAKGQNLLVATAFAPPGADGKGYGGTMVVVPYEAFTGPKVNTHQKCKEILATRRAALKSRYVSIVLEVDGQKRRLTSVYAPARPVPGDPLTKRSIFFQRLDRLLDKSTVMGIDANCVPDPHLDLKRDATSPYPNEGAKELAQVVDKHGLADIIRQAIGNSAFFWTSHHIVRGGTCWSRIDQIYAPKDGETQWDHQEMRDFFPPRGTVEIDHKAIQARSKHIKVKRGTDLVYISEKVFDNAGFVNQLHTHIQDELSAVQDQLEATGGWREF